MPPPALRTRKTRMPSYILKRLLQLIPIVIAITFLSFALMYLAGGDAITAQLQNQGMVASQEVIDQQRHELGLDRPFLEQYLSWLVGFFTGNLGTSYISGNDVFATFVSKLPATLVLTASSLLITLLISLPLGILAATHQNKPLDYVVRFASFIGNSLPNFFVALLLIFIFAVMLGWLPTISTTIGPNSGGIYLPGLVLPTATLALAMSAKYIRQIRATVLDELQKPYVMGARARGLSERTILIKYVLKNCLVPISTLVALSIGDLLGGTAIVETIFQWDGVGKLAVDSIMMRDYPMILAYVVWMALIYVVVNLIADIAYHRLDPRVSLAGGAHD